MLIQHVPYKKMLTIHLHIKDGPEITLTAEGKDSEEQVLSVVERVLLPYFSTTKQSSIQPSIQDTDHSNGRKTLHSSQIAQPSTKQPSDQESQFAKFCKEHDPRSDRGRILVIAEGARLFLHMDYVSTKELKPLFVTVGWPEPIDFVTTIRNASRKNCGWIERVRGKQGYYTVTEKGRNTMVF